MLPDSLSELVFPLSAVVGTFLVLMPLLTFASAALLALKRRRTRAFADFGSQSTFALLVAPTLLPLLWLISSALHQSEPSRALEACLLPHVPTTTCLDAALLLGALLGVTALATSRRLWIERPQHASLELLPDAHPMTQRVMAQRHQEPLLHTMRIAVARHAPSPVFTSGWLFPRVILDSCFVRQADEEMLRAALLHERAHILGLDTARGFLARLCLGLNPAGRLLAADLERWRHAREALCDGEAVAMGGAPLALAESIVCAARLRCEGSQMRHAAHLCGHEQGALKLRLALLLDGPPSPSRTLGHALLLGALLLVIVTPHVQGFGLLDELHWGVEHLMRR